MTKVYVNGSWLPYRQAAVHVEDRGFQFADGIYEVFAIKKGKLADETLHLDRLERSLNEIKLKQAPSRKVLSLLMVDAIKRNRVCDGLLYMQITRGSAKRDHAFPENAKPSLVIIARAISPHQQKSKQKMHVITCPDQRWARCDIKSLNLLANVLAREEAKKQGAQEAWFYNEEGVITEGASSNAWVLKGNKLYTHAADKAILNGIMRQNIVRCAKALQLEVVEQGFTREEALSADEAFISASVIGVIPVHSIDGIEMPSNAKTKQLLEALEGLNKN